MVTADAWTNDILGHLGVELPLVVLQEQVTYVQPADPSSFAPDRFPVWIWMDDPSFYGFPCYGATTIKSAQDCGGHPVDPHTRSGDVEPDAERRLVDFVSTLLPGAGLAGGQLEDLPLHPHPGPRLRDRCRCPGTTGSSSGWRRRTG